MFFDPAELVHGRWDISASRQKHRALGREAPYLPKERRTEPWHLVMMFADSGHGTSKSNIIRTWKKEAGLDSFFNCSSSPDFVPIEKAW